MKLTLKGFILLLILLVLSSSSNITLSDEDAYWIQTGVFRYEEDAEAHTNKLLSDGFNPIWSKNGFIIIYLGPYGSTDEAEDELTKLKSLDYTSIKIMDSIDLQEPEMTYDDNTSNESDENPEEAFGVKSKNYSIGSNVRMEGVMGSYTIFVPVDEHWQLMDAAYVELFYSTSAISEYKYSTLTLYVNNTPVESFWLNDKLPGQKRAYVKIPLSYLKQGFNEVSFVSYHRLTDNICEDDANQANWILLNSESRVHIEYVELPDNEDFTDFPYPFIKTSRDLPVDFIMTLPDHPRDIDIKAALMFSAYVGQVNKFSNVNYQVSTFDDAPKSLNNLIWISSVKDIPEALTDAFSKSELDRMHDDAIIRKAMSPYNENKRILYIISDNPNRIIDAVKALTTQELVDQMDKDTQWFTSNTNIYDTESDFLDYIDMKSLGYDNVFFQGRKRGSASIFVNVPPTWEITSDAKLLVRFRYSDILNFEKSSISIYINNVPVGSKGFSEDFTQDDTIILPIPEEVRQDQIYEIRFEMTLIPTNYDCFSASFSRNLWGFISNETVLYLPHEERQKYSFERYPAPFVKHARLNNLLLVLPDEIDAHVVEHASEMMSFLGRELEYIDEIFFIRSSTFTESDYDKNIIAIGPYNSNTFIKKINSALNISFNDETGFFDGKDKVELLDGFSTRAGTAQLIYSPFQEDRMILAVTGKSVEQIGFVTRYLSNLELFSRLTGDTAFVSGSGALRSDFIGISREAFEAVESDQFNAGRDSDLQRKLTSQEIQQFIIAVSLVFVIVILSVIVAARNRRKVD